VAAVAAAARTAGTEALGQQLDTGHAGVARPAAGNRVEVSWPACSPFSGHTAPKMRPPDRDDTGNAPLRR
jgi:hypothetical protein